MWTYAQRTGALSHDGKVAGTGYSGTGAGRNVPDAQQIADVGPIPDYAPPLFAATAMDDPLFDVSKGGLLPSWAQAKRPVEAHIYERGGHGFSSGTSGKLWFDEFYAWLETRGELAPTR